MDKKFDWDVSRLQLIDNKNTYLDGGEIFMTICPPQGYVVWAVTDMEDYQADIVIYGYGDTEDDAMKDLVRNIEKFMEKFNG